MEIYNNLPIDLQYYVNHMYYKEIVMKELKETYEMPKMCFNCIFHGLPCLNCAYDMKGKYGPGCFMGDKVMFSNEKNKEDEESNFNMLCYILQHNPTVRIINSNEQLFLPQYL